MRLRTRSRATAPVAALAALGLAGGLAACGGSADTNSASAGSSSGKTQLNLVAYSTPKKAFAALTAAYGKTTGGSGVSFGQSFGASGSQSRAVATGQPADVVNFSLSSDMTRLVKAGVVSKSWNLNAEKGISSDSVVVLVVRKGNPKHITGWDDLVKPGVDVITPNPSTSGGARWNIMAGYGAQLKEGKSPTEALSYVNTLLTKNVSVQPSSASAALKTFTGGKGDVLIDYESDAIAAQKAGESIQYLIPKQTILIETPIAVTSNSQHPQQAQAFLTWLWSSAGQTVWGEQGYRPVLKSVAAKFASKFPTPPQLFTIKSLGGWTTVSKTFFAPSTGSITKIEQSAGVPTASS